MMLTFQWCKGVSAPDDLYSQRSSNAAAEQASVLAQAAE